MSVERQYQDEIDALKAERRELMAMVGSILDRWQMLPGDTKQEIKDTGTAFYNSVERLSDWVEENL